MLRSIRTTGCAAIILLAALAADSTAQEPGARPFIEVRTARLTPAPGFRQMAFAYPEYLAPATRREPYLSGVYVADQPMLSDQDFGEVSSISIDTRGLHLIVRMTPEGAARMEREAILWEHIAVLVDSVLVDAAPLAGYFSAVTPLFMTLRVPRPVAESVRARLRARWPR